MSKVAYLISYDNGEQYEDHNRVPLFLVATRKRADAIVAKAAAWVEAQRETLPPTVNDVEAKRAESGEPPLELNAWHAAFDVRKDHIAALKPPFGIASLREAVGDAYGARGYLTVTEVPYYTPAYKENE